MDSPLASVEVAALTQGVTFLYTQAGELLKRRRQAKDRAPEGAKKQQEPAQESSQQGRDEPHDHRGLPLKAEDLPALEPPKGIFVPQSTERAYPIPGVLDELSNSLLDARRSLDAYLLGNEPLEPRSTAVLHAVDRLRRLLERVYATQLSFAGEHRHNAGEHSGITHVQEGGITAGGSIKADGDIAGRDLYKR